MTRRRALRLGALGVLLLAGAIAIPGAASYETVYEYETIENVEPRGQLQANVANCDMHPLQTRDCAVARYLAGDNEIRLDNETGVAERFAARYDYVDVIDGYYRPTSTFRNGSLVLDAERVPASRVRAAAAENVTDPDDDLLRALEGGSFMTTEDIREYRRYIQYEGEYYRLQQSAGERRETGLLSDYLSKYTRGPLRLLLGALGVALVWRAGEVSERADS